MFVGAKLGSPKPFWVVCNPPAIASRSALNAEPNPESGSPDIKYIRDDVLKSLRSSGSGACACRTRFRYFSSISLYSGFGQPAFINKLLIWAAVDNPSGASGDASIKTCAIGFPESAERNGPASIRREPAARIKSIIVDCWAILIRSSTTNNETVQSDSTATPSTTSQNPMCCTASEHFGRSNTIPSPTATPANTLPGISTRWSHSGFSVPAQTALMYAYIGAIVVWMIVSIMALIKLIAAIAAWRR